jgi:hypothetical protein
LFIWLGVIDNFVASTELDALLMDTSATTAWEMFTSWTDAIANYFPRYANKNIVQSMYAVNVPFMFPVLEFGVDEEYKLVGADNTTVLFRPREWRGTVASGCGDSPFTHDQCLNATEMATKINKFKPGNYYFSERHRNTPAREHTRTRASQCSMYVLDVCGM